MSKLWENAILVEKSVEKDASKWWKSCGKNESLVDKIWWMLSKVVENGSFARRFAMGLHDSFHGIFKGFTDKDGRISTFST